MSAQDNGGPAFPSERGAIPMSPACGHHHGMTLRDYFAAKALQGLLASEIPGHETRIDVLARDAYAYADEMLKARQA